MERLKQGEYNGLTEIAGVNENHGLGRLPLAVVQAGSYVQSAGMSFEDYFAMYKVKLKDESDVLKAVVDSGEVHKDQSSICITWKVCMEALDEASRCCLAASARQDTGGEGGF